MVFIYILPRFTIKGDKMLGSINHNHIEVGIVIVFSTKSMSVKR